MKTPAGVSRAVEVAQFKTTLEQRYFWMGVCDAQVEKNQQGDK